MTIMGDFTFSHDSVTGWPGAHTGGPDDPEREWSFHTGHREATDEAPDLYVIIGWHKTAPATFSRYVWPATPEGQGLAMTRPPTMDELKDFVAVCVGGIAAPMAPGARINSPLS